MTDAERRELLEDAKLVMEFGISVTENSPKAVIPLACIRLARFVRATLATPQWSSELPTVAGWYWTRYKSGSKPYPLEVEHGDSGLIAGEFGALASEIKCEWAGPIMPPGDKP